MNFKTDFSRAFYDQLKSVIILLFFSYYLLPSSKRKGDHISFDKSQWFFYKHKIKQRKLSIFDKCVLYVLRR